jgi:hypothetical protein
MIRLLQLLIFGHVHKWVTIKEGKFYDRPESSMPCGVVYYQQCEHCGKVIRRALT